MAIQSHLNMHLKELQTPAGQEETDAFHAADIDIVNRNICITVVSG